MNTDREAEVWELPIRTCDGEFIAGYSEKGLCSLDFPKPQKQKAGRTNGTHISSQVRRWHEQTIKALQVALNPLAQKLGVGAAHLYAIYVRQMVIEFHHHMSPQVDNLSECLYLLERHGFGYQLTSGQIYTPITRGQFQDVLVHAYRKDG